MRMWAGGFLTGELVRLCPKHAIGTRGGHTVDDANRAAFDRAADLGVAAEPLTFVIRPRRVRPCFAVKRGRRRCAHDGGAEREFMRATPVLFLVRPLGLPIPEVLRAIVPPLLDRGRHISGAPRRRARRHRWRWRHRRRRRRGSGGAGACRRRCRRRRGSGVGGYEACSLGHTARSCRLAGDAFGGLGVLAQPLRPHLRSSRRTSGGAGIGTGCRGGEDSAGANGRLGVGLQADASRGLVGDLWLLRMVSGDLAEELTFRGHFLARAGPAVGRGRGGGGGRGGRGWHASA
mmetsp:Transcript_72324/g.188101  ORF Transcript_72324/g.188101 Transcript_72324/m.188101 type:complete len:290 (+) Transcript_72324:1655-2524(+)